MNRMVFCIMFDILRGLLGIDSAEFYFVSFDNEVSVKFHNACQCDADDDRVKRVHKGEFWAISCRAADEVVGFVVRLRVVVARVDLQDT